MIEVIDRFIFILIGAILMAIAMPAISIDHKTLQVAAYQCSRNGPNHAVAYDMYAGLRNLKHVETAWFHKDKHITVCLNGATFTNEVIWVDKQPLED